MWIGKRARLKTQVIGEKSGDSDGSKRGAIRDRGVRRLELNKVVTVSALITIADDVEVWAIVQALVRTDV